MPLDPQAGDKFLITEAYRALQQELHRESGYGRASVKRAPLVAELIREFEFTELLDYGAGKGRLGETLATLLDRPIAIRHYDPAIPHWSASPEPCEFVACIDVLEHIEPDLILNVLDDLERVVDRMGFFTIHTGAARRILPDGRNAHLLQRPPAWWLPKLLERFGLVRYAKTAGSFWVLVEAI